MDKEQYREVREFGPRNSAFRDIALDLLQRLVPPLVEKAELTVEEIDVLLSTTVTGLVVPTLEARLMNRLGFSPGVKRVPLFGLGCLAGAAGIARLHDILAETAQSGLLLAVELCSLTLQTKDVSIPNLIATGLFGDGAAGVVMAGTGHEKARELVSRGHGCKVVATRSVFFPDSEDVMGWEFDSDGFKIVLNSKVPEYAAGPVSTALLAFLAEHGLEPKDIDHWLAHPGGPKVIDAMEEGLGVPGALDRSRRSLSEIGNISSVSVLTILHEVLATERPQLGDWGLLMAMGPAFCTEFVLLKWEP